MSSTPVQGLTSGDSILRSLLASQVGAGAAVGVSAATAAGTSSTLSPRDQFKSDMQSLISAVKSGDMTGAQTALKALQSDASTAQASGGAVPYSAGSTSSSPTDDFQALINAVKSGDTTGAQNALAKLQDDMSAVGGGHHHHHHHHGGASSATAAGATTTDTATTTAGAVNGDTDGDGDAH